MFSFWPRRRKLLDLREQFADPIEAWCAVGDRPFLIDVPVANIRAIGFQGDDPHNPFVLTLRAYGEGRCAGYKGSAMEDFYRVWQPFAGVPIDEPPRPVPWKARGPNPNNTAAARREREGFKETAGEFGASPDEVRGHIKGGPVTEAFGEITFRRLAKLYDSIRRKGYRPEESPGGHLRGECFARGKDWRVSVGSGKHRICALLALGWTNVPVQFGPPKLPVVTRREDAQQWPHVRSGVCPREQALADFDALFGKTHPSGWRPPES